MAKVNINNVVVLDNPSPFRNPFQFEVTFECLDHLEDDLEWKLIYVSSAESEDFDQVLDSVLVGPIPPGKHMFVFQAPCPDTDKIPINDVVGVTVVLLTCSYRSKEFIRVGYYVNNDYSDPELKEVPPAQPDFDKLHRNILATAPRVTKFPIDWGDSETVNDENCIPLQQIDHSCNQGNPYIDQSSNQVNPYIDQSSNQLTSNSMDQSDSVRHSMILHDSNSFNTNPEAMMA